MIRHEKSSRREHSQFTESIVEDAALAWLEGPGPLGGRVDLRVMGVVVERTLLHHDELLEGWRLARESAPLNRIARLE